MRQLIALVLILLLNGCYSVERDCSQFKTGTFEFESLVGSEMLTTTFVRNDSLEIDYFRGMTDTATIRWINPCECILTKLNPKNHAEQKAIHMKILSTTNNEYRFEYSILGDTKKQKGKAKRIDMR